jgi:ADP-ribose pyrophosphatase
MGTERTGTEEVWQGKIAGVRIDSFRADDGEEYSREIVTHPGAVGVVAHDGEKLYLVRQPREPVGESGLLELPAGKLDEEGESVLATAKRELAEEIGKGAHEWRHLATFYSSPAFSDAEVHVYLATELYDEHAESDENERIEIETVPLSRLDDLIRDCRDSKTLVGLLWLKAFGEQ